MDWLLVVGGFLANTIRDYSRQTGKVNVADYPITPPIADVSIVIPAFNEESFIEATLLDLQTQNIVQAYPRMFEVIVVDNESTDHTATVAMNMGATVVSSFRGKLNAKAVGVQASHGNIIVFLDADNRLPPNFLNLLLRHFHKPNVVAVSGCFILEGDPLTAVFNINLNSLNGLFCYQINGSASAVLRWAWDAVNGHNLSIDQQNRYAVWWEEEFVFPSKLKAFGRVIVDAEATITAASRFQYCIYHSIDEECDSPYCLYCRDLRQGERF